MTTRQVITVYPDGSIAGLQRKKGQGIDLTQFGTAEIVRASEIVWSQERQAWTIDVLDGPAKGVVTGEVVCRFVGCAEPGDVIHADTYQGSETHADPLFFGEYEDAVKVEIFFLDYLRLHGMA